MKCRCLPLPSGLNDFVYLSKYIFLLYLGKKNNLLFPSCYKCTTNPIRIKKCWLKCIRNDYVTTNVYNTVITFLGFLILLYSVKTVKASNMKLPQTFFLHWHFMGSFQPWDFPSFICRSFHMLEDSPANTLMGRKVQQILW